MLHMHILIRDWLANTVLRVAESLTLKPYHQKKKEFKFKFENNNNNFMSLTNTAQTQPFFSYLK